MMNYENKTPEEIVRRYWRGFLVIKALRWVICLICIGIVVRLIWDGRTGAVFLLVMPLYLLSLWLIRLVVSFRFLSLNVILNRDCDAVKFTEVSRLLREKIGRRSSGMAGLNMALGLYWSGRFEEAAAALTNVDLKRRRPATDLMLWNVDFNCRVALGDLAGAGYVRLEVEKAVPTLRRAADRSVGERLLTYMEGALALEAKDYHTFRAAQNRLEAAYTTAIQSVAAAYRLAVADLVQGEPENARARLEYVIREGGTLYCVEEARRLLAELGAGA